MKIRIAFLLALCMIAALLVGCGEKADPGISVETPYAVLRVPSEFDGALQWKTVSEEPYVLAFTTTEGREVFSLHFNQETANLLGTLPLDGENVVIYADFSEVDKQDAQYATLMRYQLAVGTIIENLAADYGFQPNVLPEPAVPTLEAVTIETKVVTLKYPAEWKDRVTVEVTDERAAFSCEGTKLFDVCFFDGSGYPLGTYDGTPISIVSYDIDPAVKSETELQDLYAMQEGVNFITQNLMQDPKFSVT